jgi:small subunit ribosomal protein S1
MNYVAHPYWGAVYYMQGRNAGYGPLGSFLVAFTASTFMWEYGVEAFAPSKHIVKEDGTSLKVDEQASFKVIEFSKEFKRIVVSHSKIHEDLAGETKPTESTTSTENDETRKNLKKQKESYEKATLGDLDVLAQLKSEMEESEKKK